MKRSKRFQKPEERTDVGARELTATFLGALEGAPYTAGAVALTTVLGVWIGRQGKRPVLDAGVYSSVLEALVKAISDDMAARGGARDVAA